jgi:uncharacterized RDD family membrane protein YckC
MEILPKYQTFWPRFWAGWIDVLIFVPIWLIDSWLANSRGLPLLLASWYILYTLSADIYSVTMHARYGQTIGKMVMGIRVLDLSESSLSLRQALLRDAVPIVFSVIAITQGVPLILVGLSPYYSVGEASWIDILTLGSSLIWFGAELVTMLTNSKRRAIHDYIAGSVVVRVSYFEAEAKSRVPAA